MKTINTTKKIQGRQFGSYSFGVTTLKDLQEKFNPDDKIIISRIHGDLRKVPMKTGTIHSLALDAGIVQKGNGKRGRKPKEIAETSVSATPVLVQLVEPENHVVVQPINLDKE